MTILKGELEKIHWALGICRSWNPIVRISTEDGLILYQSE